MAEPDLSEFLQNSHSRNKPCVIGTALEQFDAQQAAQLKAALAQPVMVITNTAIQMWLEKRGHKASGPAVTAHRRGQCACARA